MTLKDKIFDAVFDDMYEFKKGNILPRLLDIVDDFAIDFAEWRLTTFIKNLDQYTTRELLEIYKQEKGL
jgi:hypothetical protein